MLHRSRYTLLASAFFSIWFMGFSSLQAQDSKVKTGSSRLIIGTVAAERGTVAAIPVYYEPEKGVQIAKLHLDLDFVSNSVKFAKSEKGIVPKGQDFNLDVTAKDVPPDQKQIKHTQLSIDVSPLDSSHPVPDGLLGFLNFEVPSEAKPFSIALNPVSSSARDASDHPVKIAVEAGKIIVSVPDVPMVGCFFFSH